jgi:hypothetical protein
METHAGVGPARNAEAIVAHLERLGYEIWLADDTVIYALKAR